MSEANGEYPPVSGSAWDRLMAFLADDSDMTPEQVRADLEAEGVDVDAFLKRVHDTIERCTQNTSLSGVEHAAGKDGCHDHRDNVNRRG